MLVTFPIAAGCVVTASGGTGAAADTLNIHGMCSHGVPSATSDIACSHARVRLPQERVNHVAHVFHDLTPGPAVGGLDVRHRRLLVFTQN
ncbi:hypothetical protein DIPPA_14384 [Diplonema papillatum]|nr:hypothetical protein DIPPA_14384 [Diplonema papillatum]